MDYVERTEIIQIILSFVNHKPIMRNLINKIKNYLPYLGLHNAHWPWKSPEKTSSCL